MEEQKELEDIKNKLTEIKQYDDYFWLRYLQENTIFDTDNIKAQKDWLIASLERFIQLSPAGAFKGNEGGSL
ncbi:hypothetical protein AB4Z50_35220 [Paenibacillus sp. 2TAB26]|uniref:hypothetical protein n=1 Tax=Paenibacillus sp. 2TAB26 TaxID=3233005 RepID=UPI003F987E96